MERWYYFITLLVSIGGLATLDWRHKLAFWHDATRSAITLFVGVVIFSVWDLLGIAAGFFRHGQSRYTLPLRILPEFPLEEVFFLVVLSYTVLVMYAALRRRWPTT